MNKLKYIIIVPLLILVAGILFYQTSKENMLSEPTLKVYVSGMDTADYWLDLLIDDSDIGYERLFSGRIRETVKKLEQYVDEDGYRPAMLSGSEEEFIGRLDGFLMSDGSYRHEFWGTGIPEEFKVAILTRDERLIVSDLVKIRGYHSEVRFDFDDIDKSKEISSDVGKIREVLPWTRIIFSFFLRLLVAILIKLSIAEAFGFKSKQSIGLISKSSVITQVVLNIMLATQFFYGAKYAFIVFFTATVLIAVAESIIYALWLKEKNKQMRVIVALIANLASAVAGYFLIYFVEWAAI